MPGVLPIWIMVGQGLTVLGVGAGKDCSDIFFLSPIISFFFLPLSVMDRWVTCGLRMYAPHVFLLSAQVLRSSRSECACLYRLPVLSHCSI